jgi:hypothetical protein
MDGKEKATTKRQALRRIEVRERFRMSAAGAKSVGGRAKAGDARLRHGCLTIE